MARASDRWPPAPAAGARPGTRGGRGEVGDREAPVGQVVAALELRLEALEAGNDLHSRVLGRLCAARSVAKRHERAAVIQHHASQPRELWRHPGCDLGHALGLAAQLIEHEPARVWTQLAVEPCHRMMASARAPYPPARSAV